MTIYLWMAFYAKIPEIQLQC